MYNCDICKFKFDSQPKLNQHYLEFHKGDNMCNECGKSLDSVEDLINHKNSEHS
jgi:hypothetical protein